VGLVGLGLVAVITWICRYTSVIVYYSTYLYVYSFNSSENAQLLYIFSYVAHIAYRFELGISGETEMETDSRRANIVHG